MSKLLELTSTPGSVVLNIQEILARIANEYAQTTDPVQREILLRLHYSSLNTVQAQVASRDLPEFLDARTKHYRTLLAREVVDSAGIADAEALERVTAREIAAGRMTEDDQFRRFALQGAVEERAAQDAELAQTRARRPVGLWQWLRSVFLGR